MEIELVFKIAAIGIIVAILQQILAKSGRDEYALLTVLAGILSIIFILFPKLQELYDSVQTFFSF